MTNPETSVRHHYGRTGLLDRIITALKETGIDPERLNYEDLFPFDQLHSRGIAATREHAERAGIRPGMQVLDLGCGIGGAARYLAAACGCRVTAIDLTEEFVEVAQELTARCALADRIEFRRANALTLPFEDGSFDHVWCQYVTMNIADKRGTAKEVTRVLKPGGRFSCSEVAQGPGGAPVYPLPWASDPSYSFVALPEQMRAALEAGGLRVLEQIDLTPALLASIRENMRRAERGDPPQQRNGVVMGDDFAVRLRNVSKCAMEGRLIDLLTITEKM